MTPVGHSLVGVAVATLCIRPEQSLITRGKVVACLILAANLPDLPLPYWGHSRYDISHSLFTGLAIVVCYGCTTRVALQRGELLRSGRFIAAASLALLSHYLLDSLYRHGKGLPVFWPFSPARIALPVPWLARMQLDPLWSWHNLEVWGIELLMFGSLCALVLAIKRSGTTSSASAR